MTHSNEPPHKCHICHKQSTNSSQVKQETGLSDHSSGIADEEPLTSSMIGKRSVATATTDDLLFASQPSSCRVTSKVNYNFCIIYVGNSIDTGTKFCFS